MVITPARFERTSPGSHAERAGVEPPDWALQEIPPTTKLGPPIENE